jgi:ubiquinone/menaquinone biosynthesis C-methylase UbiE
MEGPIAAWYAKNTAGALPEFRAEARRIAAELEPGAVVLEIAPGPGYLAVELAKLGSFRVTGLDVSHSFVRIAKENAARAGVHIEFRQGNVSQMPFAADWFDFLVCRAAFKNFSDPVGALKEMHRVLRPGGKGLILDMRKDATNAAIADEVAKMDLGLVSRFMTSAALHSLKKRAYTQADFERMIAQTPFGTADIHAGAMGFEIRLEKR